MTKISLANRASGETPIPTREIESELGGPSEWAAGYFSKRLGVWIHAFVRRDADARGSALRSNLFYKNAVYEREGKFPHRAFERMAFRGNVVEVWGRKV